MFLIGFEYGAFMPGNALKCALYLDYAFIGAFTMNHRDQENEYDDIDDFLQVFGYKKS